MESMSGFENFEVVSTPILGKKKPLERFPWPRNSEPDDNGKTVPLGIDVVAKENDIKKIVHKFFSVKDVSMEELLQEVYLAIIHKNTTRSAHDSRKSSFGHYIYMIANNVCIGFVNRNKKHAAEKESVDTPQIGDDERSILERQEFKDDESYDTIFEAEKFARKTGRYQLARYLRAVRQGVSSDIIREALSFGTMKMNNKSMKDMRDQVKDLVEDMKLHLSIELDFGNRFRKFFIMFSSI